MKKLQRYCIINVLEHIEVNKFIKATKSTLIIIKRLISESRKASPKVYIAWLFVLTFLAILPTLLQFFNAKAIDELILLIGMNTENRVITTLVILIVISVLLRVLEKIGWAISEYFNKLNYYNFEYYFTFNFYKKASVLDISFYEDERKSNIIEKAKDASDWRVRESAHNLIWIFFALFGFITSLIVVVTFSPLLFILILITSIPQFVGNIFLGKEVWGIWDANSTSRKKYWWTLYNLRGENNVKEMRVMGSRDYLIKIVESIYFSFTTTERGKALRRVIYESVLGNISTVGIMSFWIFSVFQVLNGNITIGLLTFYTGAAFSLSSSLQDVVGRFSRLYEDSLYLKDYFTFIDLENSLKSGSVEADIVAPSIEFKNVYFKYPGTKKYIFEDLNLIIEAGEKIAFVGVNGAGKSTIIKLICRFYDVTKGQILINGIDIKDYTLDSLYKLIGILFQDFVTYGQLSVKNNIEIGNVNKEGKESDLEEAIYKADAKDFIDQYKYKMDQLLDRSFDDGITPSGGQWQRIALARAFFRDAPLLILDEPTSAIDAKGEADIFERLFKFSEQKTVIIVSHRFSTVRLANKIFVISGGKLIESGTHEELMKINGKYAESFNLQAKGYK